MTTDPATTDDTSTDDAPIEPSTAYQDALAAYLDAADWLSPADVVFTVHAEQIARSLDAQLTAEAEVQSALASTFTRVMDKLEARRPKPTAPPGPQVPGQSQVFDFLQD